MLQRRILTALEATCKLYPMSLCGFRGERDFPLLLPVFVWHGGALRPILPATLD